MDTLISKKNGGLNVFDFARWNNACLIKLLWNLSQKDDNLWVRWVHSYYIKSSTVMSVPIKNSCSWILRAILNKRQQVQNLVSWNKVIQDMKICKRQVYKELGNTSQPVAWRALMYGNEARP